MKNTNLTNLIISKLIEDPDLCLNKEGINEIDRLSFKFAPEQMADILDMVFESDATNGLMAVLTDHPNEVEITASMIESFILLSKLGIETDTLLNARMSLDILYLNKVMIERGMFTNEDIRDIFIRCFVNQNIIPHLSMLVNHGVIITTDIASLLINAHKSCVVNNQLSRLVDVLCNMEQQNIKFYIEQLAIFDTGIKLDIESVIKLFEIEDYEKYVAVLKNLMSVID